MATTKKSRKPNAKKSRYIGKPLGLVQERVQAVGPEHFGVISIDCAKKRSKWMMCNFYGNVIVEPASVDHHSGAMACMITNARQAIKQQHISDVIIAIEMTGVYHRPILNAWRNAGFETRLVHPFATHHFSKTLHPSNKTDNNDLEAIFHAAINGYGLSILPVDRIYLSLKQLTRHRKNLVKQRSRLQVQIRCLLHQTMPGYADLFEQEEFFEHATALPLAYHFTSASRIKEEGISKIVPFLKSSNIRCHSVTVEKILTWANMAADPNSVSSMMTNHWKQLFDLWKLISDQVCQTEREMAHFLVKTPYVLLMSVNGINVVSAASLAGEAGPIEHYATYKALT
ncbi:MAG: transposase, partial [Pirellula sp.]